MRTCDEQRFKGMFYLPGDHKVRVPGILTWSQGSGANLELVGGLSPKPTYRQTDTGVWETNQIVGDLPRGTIYGETVAGEPLTLWGAERGDLLVGKGSAVLEEHWQAEMVCVGAHVASENAPALQSLEVSFDDIYYLLADERFCPPTWVAIDGVDRPGERLEDGSRLLPYALAVIGGERVGCAAGDTTNHKYRIDTYATHPWISPATEAMPAFKLDLMMRRERLGPRLELQAHATTRIEGTDGSPRYAEDLIRAMNPLLGLISLTTFDAPGVQWMAATTDEALRVFLLARNRHEARPDELADVLANVFTLSDVPLNQFLDTWVRLTSSPQSNYAWSVVVGLIGHSSRMVEEHISQVLASAEGFHTWCLGNTGRQSLRDRLKSLHDGLPNSIISRLGLDTDQWSDWAVWARNHVDHGGAMQHRKVGDFFLLSSIGDSVQLITYLAALHQFSVPEIKIIEALTHNRRLTSLVERCNDLAQLPARPL